MTYYATERFHSAASGKKKIYEPGDKVPDAVVIAIGKDAHVITDVAPKENK